jgi:hypothetical protein
MYYDSERVIFSYSSISLLCWKNIVVVKKGQSVFYLLSPLPQIQASTFLSTYLYNPADSSSFNTENRSSMFLWNGIHVQDYEVSYRRRP